MGRKEFFDISWAFCLVHHWMFDYVDHYFLGLFLVVFIAVWCIQQLHNSPLGNIKDFILSLNDHCFICWQSIRLGQHNVTVVFSQLIPRDERPARRWYHIISLSVIHQTNAYYLDNINKYPMAAILCTTLNLNRYASLTAVATAEEDCSVGINPFRLNQSSILEF